MVQLTIIQHKFRQWLGADQETSHYLHQWWFDYRRIYASLGLNVNKTGWIWYMWRLTPTSSRTEPQRIFVGISTVQKILDTKIGRSSQIKVTDRGIFYLKTRSKLTQWDVWKVCLLWTESCLLLCRPWHNHWLTHGMSDYHINQIFCLLKYEYTHTAQFKMKK